jgi:hypothetical protein
MDITNKVLDWITRIKRRPLMILPNNSYSTLSEYFDGYLDALGHCYDIDKLAVRISLWYQMKNKRDTDIYWMQDILRLHSTDEECSAILLQALENYFKENPEWYKIREDIH